MKALQGLAGTISSLTNIVISLLGLAIVVSLLGGNVPFVGGVAENIIGLVQGLGDAGIVGLVANGNKLVDLETGGMTDLPGGVDPVYSPDGAYLTRPGGVF